MPYIIVDDAPAFLDFMQHVFGAESTRVEKREDGSIGHCQLTIGESTVMYSQSQNEWPAEPGGFFIYVVNAARAQAEAIARGATEIMPVAEQSYGLSGGVKDPFGNTWWITSPQPSMLP